MPVSPALVTTTLLYATRSRSQTRQSASQSRRAVRSLSSICRAGSAQLACPRTCRCSRRVTIREARMSPSCAGSAAAELRAAERFGSLPQFMKLGDPLLYDSGVGHERGPADDRTGLRDATRGGDGLVAERVVED